MVLLRFILQPCCLFNWFTFWDVFPISCFLDVSCPSLLILASVSFFHIIISQSNPLPSLHRYKISFATAFATRFWNWACFKVDNIVAINPLNGCDKSFWICLFLSFLLARLRTATLRHDDEGQASFILCRSDNFEVPSSVPQVFFPFLLMPSFWKPLTFV